MKINVWIIMIDHLRTLRDAKRDRLSLTDIFIFFLFPLLFAFLAYGSSVQLAEDYWTLSVTFFGIFIALLLNMQVAVFGIHQKGKSTTVSLELQESEEMQYRLKRVLIRELNASLSYLTLVSTVALIFSFCFFILKLEQGLSVGVSVFLNAHFALTLLMVLKRAHILFKKEFL